MSWRAGLRSGSSNFDEASRQAAINLEESLRREQARKRAVKAALQRPPSTGTTPVSSRPNTPPIPEANGIMVNYDQENAEDAEGAINNARDVKLPFNKASIELWFSLIESKMQFAGLHKQWSKRQVLIQLIPPEHHNDFKKYLIMQETAAGATAYYDLKKAILKRFGPKKAEGFDKAITRVMTGTPSQLGNQILSDICPSPTPLQNCHCADIVLGIWRRSLPSVVRNAIADMDFEAATFEAVFDKADAVWASNAANSTVVATMEAKEAGATAVAAVSGRGGGRGGNRGGRGGRGGNSSGTGRGGGQNRNQGNNQGSGASGRSRGPRHPDNPPSNACGVHWKFGKGAWHCADRHNCPWRDFENPKPSHNRNIVSEIDIID